MRDAKNSIRSAKNKAGRWKTPSKPGSPPHNITGKLKNGIRFEVDRKKLTVTIGVMKNRKELTANVLEYGGESFTTRANALFYGGSK